MRGVRIIWHPAIFNRGLFMSVIRTLDKGWSKWETVLLLIGGIGVLAVMVITTADVIARNFFNSSVSGATELVSMLLLPSFTCALPYVQARRGQIILEFATEKAPAVVKKWLDIFGIVVGIFLFGSIVSKAFSMFVQSYTRSDITSGVVAYPIWPFRLILAVVVASMIVRLLLDLIETVFTAPAKPEANDSEQA